MFKAAITGLVIAVAFAGGLYFVSAQVVPEAIEILDELTVLEPNELRELSIQPEVVTPAELVPDFLKSIMASSTVSIETASSVYYENKNTKELIKKLDVMIVLLSQINDKLTK